jgi:intracellular septation protein
MSKLLFDIFPVILFFIVYKLGGHNPELAQHYADQLLSSFIADKKTSLEQAPILLATAISIIASIAQISYLLVRKMKVEGMLWVSFIIIVVFGSATIYFQNDTFIKLKPTIIYCCYGAAFLMTQFIFKKNILKAAMGSQISMPDDVWNKLGLIWAAYFAVMGLANYYVAFTFSQETWVNFKLYSIAALPLFLIAQSFFLSKYIKENP